jgi:pantetheine-phosphate adenylyltransferase
MNSENPKINIGVYPGTFDPFTFGHLDIIKRAQKIFDKIIIAVSTHFMKNPLFGIEERVEIIKVIIKDFQNIEADTFNGLLVDYIKKRRADIIIRGLRVFSDFEYEFQMALMNKQLNSKIETIFLMPNEKFINVSSTLVKEIAAMHGNINKFVPQIVIDRMKQKTS